MAEIKSTLDLVMERTRHLSQSTAEKEAQRRGDFEKRLQGLLQAAATLGANPLDQFRSVVLPLCRRSFITAAALGFAHTVGEFGVVLMIGGNIPGETQVLSIAIYDHVEALDYPSSSASSLVAATV